VTVDAVPQRRAGRREGLGIALTGALLLLALSFGRWLLEDEGLFGRGGVFGAVETGPIIGQALGRDILWFAAVQLALHLAFGLVVWGLARASRRAWGEHGASVRLWALLWLAACGGWILAANAWLYPRSRLAENWYDTVRVDVGGIDAFVGISALLGAALLATLARAATRLERGRGLALAAGAAGLLIAGSGAIPRDPGAATVSVAERPATDARPHVILIGIDSLRCDLTQPGGGRGLTPNVDAFLDGATRFTDATTPLARTYPSWVATLTGSHPHRTGTVMNLLPRSVLQLGETLPAAFRRAGYRTFYAIDEVRFSNIDASYGFDATVTPPIGAADFLLGTIGDAPLGNLVANTRAGAWLLPQLHANRGVPALYDPDVFVRRVARALSFEAPAFVALHLTLPHWPYVWSEVVPGRESNPETWVADHYVPAIRRVDRQFADVLAMLERSGALRNAIVVVLSDHGEALGRSGDSPWAGAADAAGEAFAAAAITGHGTSVLSPHQYRVVLGVRAYGAARRRLAAPATVPMPVSLEDVAPTLDELLGLGMPAAQFDGVSLTPLLAADRTTGRTAALEQALAERIRFTETEYNPRGFLPGERQTARDLKAAVGIYRVEPSTGRVEVRPERLEGLLRDRQYAAVQGDRLLAAIPGRLGPGFRYLYVAGRGALPGRLEAAPDAAAQPAAATLWAALTERFPMAFEATAAGPPTHPRGADAAGQR
jgi:arylsulfatase A-like enzyme